MNSFAILLALAVTYVLARILVGVREPVKQQKGTGLILDEAANPDDNAEIRATWDQLMSPNVPAEDKQVLVQRFSSAFSRAIVSLPRGRGADLAMRYRLAMDTVRANVPSARGISPANAAEDRWAV
jgi:hypothetical protein